MKFITVTEDQYFAWLEEYENSEAMRDEISEEEYDEVFNEILNTCSRYGKVVEESDEDDWVFNMNRYVPLSRSINVLSHNQHMSASLIKEIREIIQKRGNSLVISFDCELESQAIEYSIAVTPDTVACAYKTNSAKSFIKNLLLDLEKQMN